MAYVDTVVVNGTEYEINTQGSKYPVVCETYVTDSSGTVYGSRDSTAAFSDQFDIKGVWRRTGTPGNYKYSLAIVTEYDGDVEEKTYYEYGTAD